MSQSSSEFFTCTSINPESMNSMTCTYSDGFRWNDMIVRIYNITQTCRTH